ncbi:phage tail protein [Weissella confusa]|uniref:phage tail spike protein n=1 Tax=Weissella confusa TaxID=1583 RepID=UPI001C0F78AB|nr:phage tail spike protein [Weissella confusa]MBU5285332.1 phage tail protein [Weissella confusa]
MTPILYSSDEIDFLNNGLGQLVDLYDVDIHEQRNGLLNLTAYYPVNGQHYADISEGNIILAKPSPLDDNHAFRIVSVALDITGYAVMIEADSITYDLTNNLSKTIHMLGDGQAAMTAIQKSTLHPHIFTFYSDITHTSESQLRYVNPMEAIAGTQGSFLQIWGGELKRENRRVAMFNRRGRDNVATFRLGKNIAGLKYTVDVSNLTTEIIPTVTVNSTDVSRIIEGATVQSSRMGNYPLVYSKMVDVSQDVKVDEGDTDDQIKAKINAFAADWFVKSANTGKDLPEVTVEVEVESLQDSADYADKFAKIETIGLTDTVTVYVPEFGVNVTAIVNELHYDPVAERVTKLSIGTAKVSWADSNKNALNDLQDKVTEVKEQVTQAVISANGKNSIYSGRNEPEHPQEGDTWFWDDGTDSGIRVFTNGKWVDSTDTKTLERINNAVDSAVNEATSHADSLNSAQASIANSISASAAAALASASTARSILASNASSMANSAAAKGSSAANSAYTAAMSGAAAAVNALSSDVGVKITSTADSLNGKLATAITSANVTASSYATVARNEAIATVSQNATTITSVAISNFGSKVAETYATQATVNQTASKWAAAVTELQGDLSNSGVRYVRINGQGNNENNGTHFAEMQVINSRGVNVASGIIPTKTGSGTLQLPASLTDGNFDNIAWISNEPNRDSYIVLDLGSVMLDLQEIKLKMFKSSRTYYAVTVQTSSDGDNWKTVFHENVQATTDNLYNARVGLSGVTVGRVSTLEVGLDGINAAVSDSTNGLSATWNLANNGQTLAVQASNAATQAITTANGIQTKVSAMGGVNQLPNTEWSPDLKGWYDSGSIEGTGVFTDGPDPSAGWALAGGKYGVSNVLRKQLSTGANSIHTGLVAVGPGVTVTASMFTYATSDSNSTVSGAIYLKFYDANKVYIGRVSKDSGKWTSWQRLVLTTTTPASTAYVSFNILTNGNSGFTYYAQPMLEFSATGHDYVAGNYNNNSYLETIRTQLAGQITDETINRTTGDNSVRQQMTDLINQQVTSVTTGYQSSLLETSNALVAQISSLNLLNNSQFEVVNGTLPGWHAGSPWAATVKVGSGNSNNVSINDYTGDGTTALLHDNSTNSTTWIHSDPVPTMAGQTFSGSYELAAGASWNTTGTPFARYIYFWDANKSQISTQGYNHGYNTLLPNWPRYTYTFTTPANTKYVSFAFAWNAGKVAMRKFSMYAGATDYGYMPSSKSGNQTVLQLFQDNWAIGIKDNAGNLINGINGDPSGMTIAAKKLTVSADTTFLGTNWLNGAVIKDASISNAQIADASITSAKIVNLDVNKISGEVANFIRAYWDGQYGSTSITSEGMTVSAGVTTTVFDENGMQLNKSNRSVGRIGVNDLYQDNSKKGLYFGLEATGDFMAWGAQNYAGNPYDTKLSWYRVGSVPSNLIGTIEGFNFQDNVLFNRPVEMRAGIKVQGTDDRLITRTTSLNGRNSPSFGTSSAGFAYVSDEVYLISNGTAYNLSKVIKALSGISNAAIPTGFASDGKAVGWYNVNFR